MTWTQLVAKGQARSRVNEAARVVEPELDMSRTVPHGSSVGGTVSKLVKWLAPASRATGAPMRSVARELEEAFPIGEY